jgi:NDP-hexose-3-ketoreductase
VESKFFKLVSVGSRSREKAERFARKFNCQATSYDGVISDDSVDAVYVSLPSGLHYEWGLKVVNSGSHLLLEKPFVDTFERAAEIIDTARKKNVIAMESLTYVYHPMFAEVSRLLRDGEIGAIRHVEASFGFPFLPSSDIRNNRSLGGGAILDNLVYPLSFCLNLLDHEYHSRSFHIIQDKTRNIDSRGFLRIDWQDVSANITYGFGFSYRNSFAIWGDKGTLHVDRAFTRPKEMPGEIIIQKEDGEKRTIAIDPANQFGLLLKAFYQKIIGADKSGVNEGENILRRMKIISEMYKASQAGQRNS